MKTLYIITGCTSAGKTFLAQSLRGCYYFPSAFLLFAWRKNDPALSEDMLKEVREHPQDFRADVYSEKAKKRMAPYYEKWRSAPEGESRTRLQNTVKRLLSTVSPTVIEGESLQNAEFREALSIEEARVRFFLLVDSPERISERFRKRHLRSEDREKWLDPEHCAGEQEKLLRQTDSSWTVGNFSTLKTILQNEISGKEKTRS